MREPITSVDMLRSAPAKGVRRECGLDTSVDCDPVKHPVDVRVDGRCLLSRSSARCSGSSSTKSGILGWVVKNLKQRRGRRQRDGSLDRQRGQVVQQVDTWSGLCDERQRDGVHGASDEVQIGKQRQSLLLGRLEAHEQDVGSIDGKVLLLDQREVGRASKQVPQHAQQDCVLVVA
ncbi:hypothetical protein PI126_g23625 [Phytophthora idaei]|nr:hypothetical protein PI126_g23625 [Phytophthora idaei]